MKTLRPSPLRALILESLLLTAFLSLLTSFIEATYSVGLLGVDIPIEILYVLFLLSPIVLLIFPRLIDSNVFALSSGNIALICWALSLAVGSKGRMLATGLGCGLFLLFFACRARQIRRVAFEIGGGLAGAILLTIALRSLRSGNLFLGDGVYLALGILVAALAISLLINERGEAAAAESESRPLGLGRTLGIVIGLSSCLVLAYFCFTSPAALARWVDASYILVVAVQLAALLLFLAIFKSLSKLPSAMLFAWNLLFLAALAFTLFSWQTVFSATRNYPIDAPAPGLLASIAFWAMVALHPVLYLDFALLSNSLRIGKPAPRTLAIAATLGSLYLLLMCFAQIFTTTYDYFPVIGPLFRDGFAFVVCLPAVLLALSILLLRADTGNLASATTEPRQTSLKPLWLGGAGLIAIGAILFVFFFSASPAPGQDKDTLRALSYNIQQGYAKNGEKGLDAQIEVMRKANADIIGLCETDSARISGGNSDILRYIADRLNMYSYYGPSPISGTFGVALLSRYPIQEAKTFFMESKGEQTAAIEARISLGGKSFCIFVTHLGNDGDLVQQEAILGRAVIATSNPTTIIIMGDFNFDPSTEQYRLTTRYFDASWLSAARRILEPGAPSPDKRIDHIFVSPGTSIIESDFLREGPSDHPAIFTEIGW